MGCRLPLCSQVHPRKAINMSCNVKHPALSGGAQRRQHLHSVPSRSARACGPAGRGRSSCAAPGRPSGGSAWPPGHMGRTPGGAALASSTPATQHRSTCPEPGAVSASGTPAKCSAKAHVLSPLQVPMCSAARLRRLLCLALLLCHPHAHGIYGFLLSTSKACQASYSTSHWRPLRLEVLQPFREGRAAGRQAHLVEAEVEEPVGAADGHVQVAAHKASRHWHGLSGVLFAQPQSYPLPMGVCTPLMKGGWRPTPKEAHLVEAEVEQPVGAADGHVQVAAQAAAAHAGVLRVLVRLLLAPALHHLRPTAPANTPFPPLFVLLP